MSGDWIMKKTVKVAAVILGLGVVFAAGTFTGNASLNWKQNAENRAFNELLEVRNETQAEILDDTATDITTTIDNGITDTVDTTADELKRLMEEYYRMKLEGLTDSPEFKDLEARIETLMNNIYGSYKTEVDKVFTEVGF
jgi:DNA-binding ferritin-like protein (Dps family)